MVPRLRNIVVLVSSFRSITLPEDEKKESSVVVRFLLLENHDRAQEFSVRL